MIKSHLLPRLLLLGLALFLGGDGPDLDLDLLALELIVEVERVSLVHIPPRRFLAQHILALQRHSSEASQHGIAQNL